MVINPGVRRGPAPPFPAAAVGADRLRGRRPASKLHGRGPRAEHQPGGDQPPGATAGGNPRPDPVRTRPPAGDTDAGRCRLCPRTAGCARPYRPGDESGRANVCTPVTNATLVCRT